MRQELEAHDFGKTFGHKADYIWTGNDCNAKGATLGIPRWNRRYNEYSVIQNAAVAYCAACRAAEMRLNLAAVRVAFASLRYCVMENAPPTGLKAANILLKWLLNSGGSTPCLSNSNPAIYN